MGIPGQSVEERRATLFAKAHDIDAGLFDMRSPAPLAIGIRRQFKALGWSNSEAKTFLEWWCRRPQYHEEMADGGNRYNLDASPADEITADQREHAKRMRDKLCLSS